VTRVFDRESGYLETLLRHVEEHPGMTGRRPHSGSLVGSAGFSGGNATTPTAPAALVTKLVDAEADGRVVVETNGDITFYRDDGSTVSLLWDETDTRFEFAERPYSTTDAALLEVVGHTHNEVIAFSEGGVLSVGQGEHKFVFTEASTLIDVRLAVGTSPTGADLIVDLESNGGTDDLFTTQANRPTVPGGDADGVGAVAVPDVTAMSAGDYVRVAVDQIGSTVAGSDLTVNVRYTIP
jgi:hypothetical protein